MAQKMEHHNIKNGRDTHFENVIYGATNCIPKHIILRYKFVARQNVYNKINHLVTREIMG